MYSFWYGLKDLFTLHKLADKFKLSLQTIKTDEVTSSRKDEDLHRRLPGRLRGE